MRVFVDTNVLLDVFSRRTPFYDASARIWALAEGGQIEAFISAISFNNAFYVIRKLSSPAKAQEAMRWLRDEFKVVPLSEQIIHQAVDSPMGDFEDAIQFFSASQCAAQAIITRNPDDFPSDGVAVMTPEEFLAIHGV